MCSTEVKNPSMVTQRVMPEQMPGCNVQVILTCSQGGIAIAKFERLQGYANEGSHRRLLPEILLYCRLQRLRSTRAPRRSSSRGFLCRASSAFHLRQSQPRKKLRLHVRWGGQQPVNPVTEAKRGDSRLVLGSSLLAGRRWLGEDRIHTIRQLHQLLGGGRSGGQSCPG